MDGPPPTEQKKKRGRPPKAATDVAKTNIKKPTTSKAAKKPSSTSNSPLKLSSTTTKTTTKTTFTGRARGRPKGSGTSAAASKQKPATPAPSMHADTSTDTPKKRTGMDRAGGTAKRGRPPKRKMTENADESGSEKHGDGLASSPKRKMMAKADESGTDEHGNGLASSLKRKLPAKDAESGSEDRGEAEQKMSKAVVTFKSHKTELKVESMEQRRIVEDSTGHSYESIFAKCMDAKVTAVNVEDPWLLNSYHQLVNLVKFCELLVCKCPNLRFISLITQPNESQLSAEGIYNLNESLRARDIELLIDYMEGMHDREIRFSNGWLVKMGRGLDIYKSMDKFKLGSHDYHLRPCKATMIEIFKTVVTTNADPSA